MEFQSLEDKAEFCSLQSLRVQHGPDHLGPGTEDLGGARDLSAPVQVRPPLGKPGGFGRPVKKRVTPFRGEKRAVFGSATVPSKGSLYTEKVVGPRPPDFLPSQLGQRRYLARILSAFGFEA